MKRTVTITLLFATILLVGCGNTTQEEIEDNIFKFYDELGLDGKFEKQVDHYNITEYRYEANNGKHLYQVQHFVASDGAKKSQFHNEISKKYSSYRAYALLNKGLHSVALIKTDIEDSKRLKVKLTEEEVDAANNFAKSINGAFSYYYIIED